MHREPLFVFAPSPCFVETGGGRAAYGKGDFYAEPVPEVKLHAPAWHWHAGKVCGLRARGNFTVDIEWKAGKVTQYRITAPAACQVTVRVNGETKTVQADKAASPARE